jgi:N-ethylmaleimide reductase
MTTAFDPIDLGPVRLANRIAMAPMTRSRAFGPGNSPTDMTATYYAQRAGAGLIITEGTQPSVVGQGYPSTPGLHSAEQVEAWRKVTGAVHEKGGVIFAQLMHAGRVGHPSLLPDGLTPVGPSPVAAQGQVFTPDGLQDMVTPKELTEEEILQTIAGFVEAARNAIAAGFDGVEIHGANGYLPHQFLSTNTNLRTDGWGGSVTGRIRFHIEVARAVAEAIGADRTGIRISPNNGANDTTEDDHRETYRALVPELDRIGLVYLHVGEGPDRELSLELRKQWSSTFILNPSTPGGTTGPEHLELIEDGTADILSFGSRFLANPDLPRRLREGGPFNTPDTDTFYGGDAKGYIDYPALD